jgi:hypothetical protein
MQVVIDMDKYKGLSKTDKSTKKVDTNNNDDEESEDEDLLEEQEPSPSETKLSKLPDKPPNKEKPLNLGSIGTNSKIHNPLPLSPVLNDIDLEAAFVFSGKKAIVVLRSELNLFITSLHTIGLKSVTLLLKHNKVNIYKNKQGSVFITNASNDELLLKLNASTIRTLSQRFMPFFKK